MVIITYSSLLPPKYDNDSSRRCVDIRTSLRNPNSMNTSPAGTYALLLCTNAGIYTVNISECYKLNLSSHTISVYHKGHVHTHTHTNANTHTYILTHTHVRTHTLQIFKNALTRPSPSPYSMLLLYPLPYSVLQDAVPLRPTLSPSRPLSLLGRPYGAVAPTVADRSLIQTARMILTSRPHLNISTNESKDYSRILQIGFPIFD